MSISAGQLCYLFEAAGVDKTTLLATTFLFASSPGYNHPSAPGPYDPVLKTPANVERHAFGTGQSYGTSQAPFTRGPVTVLNVAPDLLSAAPYDSYLDKGFDGQLGRLLLVDPTQNYSTAKVVLTGTMEQVFDDGVNTLTFAFRDPTLALDQPFLAQYFKGTNSGATGVEGTANDLKGKLYPYGFGPVLNASPAPANSVSLVYQLSYRQISAIVTVYDKGVALTVGTAQTSLANLLAGTPLASHFDYYLGSATDGAYIKLGTSPAGAVTVDFNGDATGSGYVTTTADIFKRILLMALPTATVSSADITALNSAQGAAISIYINGDTTYRQVLDQIASGAGCFYNTDSAGTWRIRRVDDPGAGTSVSAIRYFLKGVATVGTDSDIIDIKRERSNDPQSSDPNNGVPAWCVNANYAKNWTIQAAGEIAGASPTRAAFTGQQFRSTLACDSATSSSTVTVGTGSKAFTVNEPQGYFVVGRTYRVQTADATKIMVGTCSSFAAGVLTLNVATITGSGSASAWNIDGTRAVHSLARQLSFDTLFSATADATAEAQRLFTLYSVRRDFITVTVQLQSAVTQAQIDLGSIVTLQIPRWGYGAGKQMLVLGIVYDAAANTMTLELWG